MWTRLGLVMLTSLMVGQGVRAQPGTVQVQAQESVLIAALLKRLTSTEVNWRERVHVQKELMKLPPLPVLLALLPEMAKTSWSEGWNGSGSAETDAQMGMPPRIQVLYRVNEVWNEQDRRLGLQEGGRAALDREIVALLQKVGPQGNLLSKLANGGGTTSNWVPEAEAPLAALFLNPAPGAGLRMDVLECLLQNTGTKYFADAKKMARSGPENSWQERSAKENFIKMLIFVDSRNRKVPGKSEPDVEMLRMGFGLLAKLEKGKAGGGYFLATSLGSYVGQKFSPDQDLPKYKGELGLADAFFADTSKNALAWWEGNQK